MTAVIAITPLMQPLLEVMMMRRVVWVLEDLLAALEMFVIARMT